MFWKKLFGTRADAEKRAKELVAQQVDASQPLAVRHYAYFGTPAQQEQFVTAVGGLGFRIDRTHAEAPGKFPFSVSFSKTEIVSAPEFEASCSELSELASRLGGEYDGWEVAISNPASVTVQ